ncbi:GNAT family N-acetyltransferase [Enterococcus thailandicus]
MNKKVKELGSAQIDEMFDLAAYAFNFEDTFERRERFQTIAEHSWNYGFFNEEEQLMSQVMATPFPVAFHGKELLMAGIGYVASYPEARGQGGINQIMEQILTDCRERDVTLSYLAPFSYPFYRRYGYELLFEKVHYELASRDFPAVKKVPGKMVRTSFDQAQEAIAKIYPKMADNQRGAVAREAWWIDFKFRQKKGHQFALYYDEAGAVAGYLVYRLDTPTFTIVEWGYLTHTAFQALARFVGSHSGAFETFAFACGYAGNNLNTLLANPFAKTTITPDMMARIVDLAKFLAAYPFPKIQVAFAVEVTEDAYASWNEGIFEVVLVDGEVRVNPVTDSMLPRVSGTIQSLTQLFMGYKKVQELVFQEKLICSEALVEKLAELIPDQKPVLNDYF